MYWLYIGILLTIVLLLTVASLWLLGNRGFCAKVFADEHFREVAARLPALKRAALERLVCSESGAVCPSEDPQGMLTSAGLAVLYLIGREGRCFHHDLSVSSPIRAYTIHAVGNVFSCFLGQLLGIDRERLHLRISSRSIHHAGFTLNAEEQEQFAARPVAPLSSEELAAFRLDWALSWRTGWWERIA